MNGTDYQIHPDGYDLLPCLTGATENGPRRGFVYCNDDRQLTGALRAVGNRVYGAAREGDAADLGRAVRRAAGAENFNLRTDPYERAGVTSNTYYDWLPDRVFLLYPANEVLGEFLMTFKGYPPHQNAGSFNLRGV